MIPSTIWTISLGFFLTLCQYCFLKEMLGVKYRYTYVWFYLGTWLYGHVNVWFGIAGTAWGNMIYLCVCAFALNALLFHGSIIKKSFFTLWMYGIREVACSIFVPLFLSAAILNGREDLLDVMMKAVDLMACLTAFFMMEVLKRRLHLLKRDFQDREGFYLMCVVAFICIAVGMASTYYSAGSWDAEYVYTVVIPGGLLAIGGEVLNIYCIIMLERRLLERLATQQHQLLKRHLESSKEQYERFIKIQHDMKNHTLCLAQLLEKENVEEAKNYLRQWNIGMKEEEAVIQTGSVFADALLNPKYQEAKKLGIDISIQMSVPGEDRIAPVDLCCLLANALDNAIESCQRGIAAGYPAGWIRMKSQIHPNHWVFEISNSIYIPVKRHGSGFLSSKQLSTSGIGLQNIKTIVEQYEGVLDLKSGTCFTLNVMFPLP